MLARPNQVVIVTDSGAGYASSGQSVRTGETPGIAVRCQPVIDALAGVILQSGDHATDNQGRFECQIMIV